MTADTNHRAVKKITPEDVDKALERIGQDDRYKDDANLIRAHIQSLRYRLSMYQEESLDSLWTTTATVTIE